MSADAPAGFSVPVVAGGGVPGGRFRNLWRFENLVLACVMAALAILPLVGIAVRQLPGASFGGAATLQQHLTLLIGMLGGAIAARDRRLLSLSTLQNILRGRWLIGARMFSSAVAAAISALLFSAALQLVQSEREGGKILAYDIPVWVVQLVMPAGFAAIAIRLIWHSADGWRGRLVVLALAAGLVALGVYPPASPEHLVVPALIALLVAVILGAPIFVMLGGAALIRVWGEDMPVTPVSLTHYSMATNPMLPTIPLFTMAGYFLAEGGASKRLVRVFNALLGWLRGGPAIATVVLCDFFTSFTGVSGVTILALGGLLMPVLVGAGYGERASLGLVTGSGGLGLLVPPSLPLILYAIVAGANADVSGAGPEGGVTIEKMLLGGLGPALLMTAMMIWLGIRLGPADRSTRPAFNRREALRAVLDAKWELLLPVVALVALFGGFATPVEAAAVSAFYAFAIETFVYRDFKRARDIPKVMAECGLLVGGVLLILGVALGFTNYLIDVQIPERAVEWVTGAVHSKYLFLLALNVCLLLVGCIMDMYSAIIVVVPLLVPLGRAYGIDPVHLGVIFLANMELGLLTPSAGMNIFLSAYRFNKPVLHVSRAVMPMQLVLLAGVLLITYLPPLTTLLPQWFGR